MAAIGVAGGVGVVLEEVYLTAYPLLVEAHLGGAEKGLQDPLSRLVVSHQLAHRIAFGRRILRMRTDIQVEPGSVLEEVVRRTPPMDHAPE